MTSMKRRMTARRARRLRFLADRLRTVGIMVIIAVLMLAAPFMILAQYVQARIAKKKRRP